MLDAAPLYSDKAQTKPPLPFSELAFNCIAFCSIKTFLLPACHLALCGWTAQRGAT